MENFDIDKLSRKMPYKLEADFFDKFPEQTMAKINGEQCRDVKGADLAKHVCSRSFPHYITLTLAAAAMIAIVMILSFDIGEAKRDVRGMAKEENVREFVAKLSDDDLNLIVSDIDRNYEFYTNL